TRWTADRRPPPACFLPFGKGTRQCIGEAFAWNEMKMALVALVRRWRLRPAPGHTPRPVVDGVIHLDRLPMTVHQRLNRPQQTPRTW
ncbi:cytochrome P450, partial [Actinomadura kijaniata]|uniref:cytochrome P450 n=1 Tax=Actinomadura kijaniata TaxID=46161 RepID=UPI003F1ADDB7